MAAIETIRIKDIPTTATTAAADDYVVIDGATNKVRKGLASNLITPASHLTAPDAHGFGVYTVAQLNAFTSANRPTGCVFCSDCLVPEGVGSPVVWNGAKWVCTCSGLPVTTDIWIYFEALAASGKGFDNAFGCGKKIDGAVSAVVSTGSTTSMSWDGQSYEWGTGTSSSTAGRYDSAGAYGVLKNPPSRFKPKYAFFTRTIRVSALSSVGNTYHFRTGFLNATGPTAQGNYEFVAYYDQANTFGVNAGGSNNIFIVTREAATNTITDTGVLMPTAEASPVTLSFLVDFVVGSCAVRVNGVNIVIPQTNLPVVDSRYLQPGSTFISTTGTAARSAYLQLGYFGVRY